MFEHELHTADVLDWAPQQEADRFDMVFGSPPYVDARSYGDPTLPEGYSCLRDCGAWVQWMLLVSTIVAQICKGPIFWVVAGVTRDRIYWPAPEGLMWEWWQLGGKCQLYRPCVFHRSGIPGSGGNDYLRSDWEYVICMKRPGKLPWSDNTAAGHPPKWAPGGEMSYRLSDGSRVNQWGGTETSNAGARRKSGKRDKKWRPVHRQDTKCRADGEVEEQEYAPPVLANPGNVFSGLTGGGHMGNKLAHENEAPFPEWLADPFIRSFCPPGGWVLDPFCGSGTTLAVCQKTGRNAVGVDIRQSQIDLTKRRLAQKELFARI